MIIYLSGGDAFLAKDAIDQLKAKFHERNPNGVEITEIEGEKPTINWADLHAVPLLSSSRLIVVRRAGMLLMAQQTELARFLGNIPSTTNIVIWDSKPFLASSPLNEILREAKRVDVGALEGMRLDRWLNKRAEKYGLKLSSEQLESLRVNIGANLWALDTQLQTMALGGVVEGFSTSFDNRAIYGFARSGRWQDVARALQFGEPIELIIGGLTAAIKQVGADVVRRKLVDLVADIDIAVKSGLIDQDGAAALLYAYLPDPSAKRLQWEKVWLEMAY